MTSRRKIPFSNKQKKLQLQAKKAKDRIVPGDFVAKTANTSDLPTSSKKNAERYALKFRKESNEEVERRKNVASEQLKPFHEDNLEMSEEDLFPDGLKFPIRPPWNYEMSLQELEKRENRYFLEYVNDMEKKFGKDSLSHFEENLETWRQLWRVLEMSDILLVIVDIRFPNLLFPPMIYDYVVNEKKEILLILNKIDLAPPSVVVAWMHHFRKIYPQLHIILFTSFPGYNLYGHHENKAGLQKRRRRGKLRMSAEGAQQLYEACHRIVGDQVDLTSWKTKIAEEASKEFDDIEIEETISKKEDTTYYNQEKYSNGILTIGCVGQPNVGKSSIINALMGNKVVSVSKTPGHTKHFQTIFLTNNVRLCDCPGLVFPSKVPKTAQVLMGSFPIAQLREPYTTIKFLAERVNLIKLLNIKHPSEESEWSAMDICEAWAVKSGFFTAKAARPDLYRAANSILRMVLDGTIPFSFVPPNYCEKKEYWETSSELDRIKNILAYRSESGDSDIEEPAYKSESDDSSNRSASNDDTEEETFVQNKFSALLGDSD